jgi:hypothetical protein
VMEGCGVIDGPNETSVGTSVRVGMDLRKKAIQ